MDDMEPPITIAMDGVEPSISIFDDLGSLVEFRPSSLEFLPSKPSGTGGSWAPLVRPIAGIPQQPIYLPLLLNADAQTDRGLVAKVATCPRLYHLTSPLSPMKMGAPKSAHDCGQNGTASAAA